jgi:hypothetical protein
MFDTSQMDKLVVPLKWGFLADNILFLVDRHSKEKLTLTEEEKPFLLGAMEFVELVRTGINPAKFQDIGLEDLRQAVESLTVYGYVIQSNKEEKSSPAKIAKVLSQLSESLKTWVSGKTLTQDQFEQIRLFFKPIGEVTLRESNALLAPRSSFLVVE